MNFSFWRVARIQYSFFLRLSAYAFHCSSYSTYNNNSKRIGNNNNKMTSIANKNAHSAVSVPLKSSDMSVIKNRSNMNELEAETIEVVPELPFNDSEDDFSEYSDENETTVYKGQPFGLNDMDDDEEPFDEYGNKSAFVRVQFSSEWRTCKFDFNRCGLSALIIF